MEHEPHGVRRPQLGHRLRIEEEGLHAGAALVDLEHVPVTIEDQSGVRLLPLEHEIEGAPGLSERGGVQLGRPIHRRETGGRQEVVAVAQRHVKRPSQLQDHLTARLGPARLDEADVAGRDARLAGEVELAELTAYPPVPNQLAQMAFRPAHAAHCTPAGRPGHYLRGS